MSGAMSSTRRSVSSINYRMHPGNVGCLVAAKIDCCVLANNCVLDWGYAGLPDDVAATTRVAVFAFGSASSGMPDEWAASSDRPGVNVLPDLSDDTVRDVARQVREIKRPGTIVVAGHCTGARTGVTGPRDRIVSSRTASSMRRASTRSTGTRRIIPARSRSTGAVQSCTAAAISSTTTRASPVAYHPAPMEAVMPRFREASRHSWAPAPRTPRSRRAIPLDASRPTRSAAPAGHRERADLAPTYP